MNPRPLVRIVILAVLMTHAILNAQSAFTIVSAASYQSTVAPDSLASMFGANLAPVTASATLDQDGQLPTQLGGINVLVDGQAASLIYVSPLQINFVVPGSATPGTASVMVQSTDTGATRSATMQVQNAAPGVFTADASGKGAGSILNAVTYTGAPFLVETSANGGDDKRTRLSVYATGLRYAGNPSHDPAVTNVAGSVQATGQDAAGNRYSFVVEYAGAAPGYFGLDQVNIVLPPELDGAGVVLLTLAAEEHSSNIVSFQIGSLPADAVRLTGFVLPQTVVIGGDSLMGTISLNAPARSIGFPVSLRASNPAVQTPLSLTIPAGKVSASVPIATSTVATVQTVTITAQGNGAAQAATLEIDPASTVQLTNFQITPANIQGGQAASGNLALSGAAPPGGAIVSITSSDSQAQPPATVTIPSGNSVATFLIPTSTVSGVQTATLTATYGRITKTGQLTLVPVLQLTLKSSAVVGGNSVAGTVILGEPAPATGVTLNIQCDNRTIAQPPLTVTIPSGQTSIGFTITTVPVMVTRTVTITVTYAGATQSAMLEVDSAQSAALVGLTISPGVVNGGASAVGTITLGGLAPLGGSSINLLSSNPFAAQVPAFVLVAEGQKTVTFTIATSHVTAAQMVTITASAAGVSKTAALTVQ